MKAVVIHATGGPEQLTLADMPDPVPGAGEVLLDVAYAGCNWADTQVRMGIYPHAMTYPMVLGFEVAGTVAALGPGVTNVKVGDRVAVEPHISCGRCHACTGGRYHLCKSLLPTAAPAYGYLPLDFEHGDERLQRLPLRPRQLHLLSPQR